MTERLVSTGSRGREAKVFYGYAVVVAGFFAMMIMFGAQYSFGVFFKPVLSEFGWTRAITSGAYSLYMVLHGTGSLFAGGLTDRFGPRLVVTFSGILLGIGYLLMSQIGAIWQYYVFYGALASLGMSSYVPILSIVARWFTRKRGLMTGIVVSGVGAGTVLMPPVANQLITTYSWRTSYVIVGSLALVIIAVAAQFLRRDPGQKGLLPDGDDAAKTETRDTEVHGVPLRESLRTRRFWLLAGVFFSLLVAEHGILVHIAPHATDIGISTANAAGILSIIGGLSIVGRVSIGIASDRMGSKKSLAIVFALMAAALFWLQAARELWALYLFAIVFGFSYGASVSLQSTSVAELFGMKAHGAILGVVIFIAAIGGAVGPLLAGRIYDLNASYNAAFLVYGILAVIGLLLTALITTPMVKPGA